MHVNGLGTANCQATGYMAGKTAKRAQQSRFLEAASEQILNKERDYDEEAFVKNNGMECCECGCCSFICPAKRPLTQVIKSMRKMQLAKKKK